MYYTQNVILKSTLKNIVCHWEPPIRHQIGDKFTGAKNTGLVALRCQRMLAVCFMILNFGLRGYAIWLYWNQWSVPVRRRVYVVIEKCNIFIDANGAVVVEWQLGKITIFPYVSNSELDFYNWNGKWPRKREAKMTGHGRQFCMSVLVPYTAL